MPLPKLRRKKRKAALSETQQRQRLVRDLIVKVIFAGMAAIAILYTVVSAIAGSSLFIPRSAADVLDSVEMPPIYTWSSETVRLVDFAGEEQRQDSVRSATVDTETDKFQVLTTGNLPEQSLFVSDGNYTIFLDETSQDDETGWVLATDYCNGAPTIPVETVSMPAAQLIAQANPEIVTDKGVVLGVRAWELEFDLQPELIRKLMWIDFFETAAPDQMEWVISSSELERIDAGEYTVDYARAWVSRDERQLAQIDVRFTIEGGSRYRFLTQLVQNNAAEEKPLDDTELGDPCGTSSGEATLPETPELDGTQSGADLSPAAP